MPLKRKKWTEEEERTLIDKYAEMRSDGSLSKMRTREKKFRPIAVHVNAAHHALDPISYPFQWTWKDVSTKVQNMRHQYLLVKQKISSLHPQSDGQDPPVLDWADGLSHWPNFLRYKHVFGDIPLSAAKPLDASAGDGAVGFPLAIADDDGDLGLGLGFECCDGEDGGEEGFDYEEVGPLPTLQLPAPLPLPEAAATAARKKKKRRPDRRAWAFLGAQLARLKEREARLEEREAELERGRQRREREAAEMEEEREKERERARRDLEEWERRRRDEEREWEDRIERRRGEWRKRMEGMLSQHRADMDQIQTRILHDQQSIINQLLSIISQWAGPVPHSNGLSDGIIGNHHQPYLSQMMQNLHHVNGIVPGENRVVGDGPEDQFIVDGSTDGL